MPTKKKNKSLSGEDKKLIEEIIRADHAGEHGQIQISWTISYFQRK